MTGIRPPARAGLVVPVAQGASAMAGAGTALAGVLDLGGWWLTPLGLILVAAGAVPTLSTKVIHPLQARRRMIEANQDRLQSILQTPRLTTVADTDPYQMGVHRSALVDTPAGGRPPYVPREIDGRLDDALNPAALAANQRLVVVRGDPLTGKSRALWEALKRNEPTRLVYPLIASGDADGEGPECRPLATFLQLDVDANGDDMVLWIDDAGDHVRRGLSSCNLRRLVERYRGVIVAMTIQAHELAYVQDIQLERLMKKASDPHVPAAELTMVELTAARRRYPGLADVADLAYLPEWFAAVDLLRDRYRNSRHSHPFGVAIAKATIDWRRVGRSEPIARAQLRRLAALELEQIAPNRHMTDDAFDDGLAWATSPAARRAALVQPVPGTRHSQFQPFDAMVDWAEDAGDRVDERCQAFINASRTSARGRGASLTPADRLDGLGADLWQAIGDSSLDIHYQPKVEMATGIVRGAEALLRWYHPTRGSIRPARIIRVAEHIGAVQLLAIVVLQDALDQCRRWRAKGWDLSVSVNLSAHNLIDEQLVTHLAPLLEESLVPASRLTLELNETMVVSDSARAVEVATALTDLGVRLSYDDFGSGESSLARLRHLPVAEIKIDRSFVINMADRPKDRAITQSVLRLGRGLGLTTVAEGVEDRSTWELLVAYGCDQAQGFLVAEPQPGAQLTSWLEAQPEHHIRRIR